ncbi:hypothetical protein [Streptomyces fuscigenes]|uniref:hypothetical protein n=1 Tax=Streptomyces fuscigenes TaxID=1528880 RepID=UPI001F397193|nr:hypothetical protein [Streptomyces fuscigenes]MCF3960929.1 hypothetical protein [Streptomyces fuscigenes]
MTQERGLHPVDTGVGVRARTVSQELADAKTVLGMRSTAQLTAWWGAMVIRSGDGPSGQPP